MSKMSLFTLGLFYGCVACGTTYDTRRELVDVSSSNLSDIVVGERKIFTVTANDGIGDGAESVGNKYGTRGPVVVTQTESAVCGPFSRGTKPSGDLPDWVTIETVEGRKWPVYVAQCIPKDRISKADIFYIEERGKTLGESARGALVLPGYLLFAVGCSASGGCT